MDELEIIRRIVRDEAFRYSTDDMGPVEFRRLVMKAIAELADRLEAEVVELSDIEAKRHD